MAKYTNTTLYMKKIQFKETTYFLKKGQFIESDEKPIKMAAGIVSDEPVPEKIQTPVVHIEQPAHDVKVEEVTEEEKPVAVKKKRKSKVKKTDEKEETKSDQE